MSAELVKLLDQEVFQRIKDGKSVDRRVKKQLLAILSQSMRKGLLCVPTRKAASRKPKTPITEPVFVETTRPGVWRHE